jgi:hypothetical protein
MLAIITAFFTVLQLNLSAMEERKIKNWKISALIIARSSFFE